jgi:spore maturation protein SpmB
MQTQRTLLRDGFLAGARKGWSGFVWMMKILVPISLLTAVLAWSGWIEKGDFLIQPIMSWISLPAMAALPLLIGTLTGHRNSSRRTIAAESRSHRRIPFLFLLSSVFCPLPNYN